MKTKLNNILTIFLAFMLLLTSSSHSITALAASGEETEESSETSKELSEQAVAEAEQKQKDDAAAKLETEKKKAKTSATKTKLESEIKNINSEIEKEKSKQAEIKSKIASAKAEVGEKQANVYYIDGQIISTQNEIYLLETKVSLLEEDIANKLDDINYKIAEYEKNYAIFKERIRAMYMYDSSTTLGLVLGSDNYVDFLTTTDNLNRIAKHDEKLMQELEVERLALVAEKKSLEATQKDLESSATVAEGKRQELSGQKSVAQAQVYEAADLQSQFENDLASSVAKSKQMQAEINTIYDKIQSLLTTEAYVGGAMGWPVPGYSLVTSEFGPRFNGADYHTGIDISGGGVHGAPVAAANDGTVVLTNWSYTQGVSYGIYVIIDHGGGTTTLYAHLSNIAVTNGQKVTRGQTIGNVGNTGWSTGPHLHFEIREGKTAKNPRGYL